VAKSLVTIPAGQVLTVTPCGNVQVYWPGAAAAGGFLAAATTYGPYAIDRVICVDGQSTTSLASYNPASFRGTFICNGATPVTVANANVLITDEISISLNTVGGTVGAKPAIQTITGGTGFTVKGTAGDTSIYNYAIVRNAT
jgi:hypothetical protein